MSKKLILFFVIISNLIYCCSSHKGYTKSIEKLYQASEYNLVIEKRNNLRNDRDTTLYVISCARMKRFDLVDSLIQKRFRLFLYLNYLLPDTSGLNKIAKDNTRFEYEKYNSLDLLKLVGYYGESGKLASSGQYDYLLRASVANDTNNVYAIHYLSYQLMCLGRHEQWILLLEHAVKIAPRWQRLQEMLQYCKEKSNGKNRYNKMSLKNIAKLPDSEYSQGDRDCSSWW